MRIALQNGLLNKKLFIVFFINKKIIYLHKLKKKIMKTLLSLLIIMCFGFTIYAQGMAHNPSNIYSDGYVSQIKITIGHEDLGYPSGYDILGDEPGEKLGTRCPALLRYVNNKSDYVGGSLIDETNNKKTTIVDIKVEIFDNYSILTVYGEDFNCSVHTETGYILEITSSSTLFGDIGKHIIIWKIIKI